MKDKIVLLIVGCFALFLSSCLGDNQSYEYDLSKDAQVYKFHLKSDSIPKLDSVKFTIDQRAGADDLCAIYNVDSMPYGTVLKDKVICTFETKGVIGIQVIQYALKTPDDPSKDTIWWNASDSLNFSKPVEFITYAQDGVTKKKYLAELRIHQVLPDSMVWQEYSANMLATSFTEQTVLANADSSGYLMYAKENNVFTLYTSPISNPQWTAGGATNLPANALIQQMVQFNDIYLVPTQNGQLYKSVSATDWAVVPNATVKTLLGVINKEKDDMLCIIDGNDKHAVTTDLVSWNPSSAVLASDFPVSGFSNYSYKSKFNKYSLVVVAGRNATGLLSASWATEDGLSWIKLTNDTEFFTPREGAMLTPYDGKLYLIGGFTNAEATKEIYVSPDHGVSWSSIDALKVLPATYEARAFGSVQVNKEHFLFIFGGKTTQNGPCLDQCWSGRINRLSFAIQK